MNILALLVTLFLAIDNSSNGHIEVTARTNAMYLQKVIFTTDAQTFEWTGFGENNTIIGKTTLEPKSSYQAEVFFSPDNGDNWYRSDMKTTTKDNCVLFGSEDSEDYDYDDAQILVCHK